MLAKCRIKVDLAALQDKSVVQQVCHDSTMIRWWFKDIRHLSFTHLPIIPAASWAYRAMMQLLQELLMMLSQGMPAAAQMMQQWRWRHWWKPCWFGCQLAASSRFPQDMQQSLSYCIDLSMSCIMMRTAVVLHCPPNFTHLGFCSVNWTFVSFQFTEQKRTKYLLSNLVPPP